MSAPGAPVLRRTWPQRLVILGCVAVAASALLAAWFINDVYRTLTEIPRVDIPGNLLLTDTEPGAPVNFLIIGEDSVLGLEDDDPILIGREIDPQLRFQADSITILRVDPNAGQAWVLSLPRDLLVDDRGSERRINSVFFVGGPERLIEAITENFDISINHFVSLDFVGFRSVVDEIGGVPVWFEHPARDLGSRGESSGLNIPTGGCHVLDGVEALQYVRARNYQELMDDEWVTIGNSDFGRIERQQDFLVLALDRAIARGARTPSALTRLIEAGAESVLLDSELSVAELVEVGKAFSDFDPENLQRFEVQVETVGSGSSYQGERLQPEVNGPLFEVFRGAADLQRPEDVPFDLYWEPVEGFDRPDDRSLGFPVDDVFEIDAPEGPSVIVYPEGERSEAETIAVWIEPIPRLVEDPDATEVSLFLGSDHQQILFFLPHAVTKMRAEVATFDDDSVPDFAGAELAETTTSEQAITTTTTSTTTPTTTTIEEPEATTPPTTSRGGIIGRPPEGERCG